MYLINRWVIFFTYVYTFKRMHKCIYIYICKQIYIYIDVNECTVP